QKGGGLLGRIARHLGQAVSHSKQSDREAIQYHYDVSNEFYAQWLDPAMVYSCAYFETGQETLAEAQTRKIDHILTKLRLKPGQTLLDIGCGWGALVLRAAEKFGARCVGITLSQNQHDLAVERVRAAGLQDRIEIRLQDYRDVKGPFDRISSVGMFEHVGLKNLPGYFRIVHDLLAPGGWALNHGITSTDPDNAETSYGGGRFIDRYVFPQGELPHIGTVLTTMQQGGLEAVDVEGLRRHYARTLSFWSEAFEAHTAQIKPL
ncbi:MAG: class I SAM-dependent methyltransferase, partial [Ottowia sp.]|nr:class I SAM-dependent methyltransferase [Ottowia sp.]